MEQKAISIQQPKFRVRNEYMLTIDGLTYLHDASVRGIHYTVMHDCRDISVYLEYDSDCGSPLWDGKNVKIRLSDIVIANHLFVGSIVGEELVDSWDEELSPALAKMITNLQASRPAHDVLSRFHLRFHSGSILEGACKTISLTAEEFR
jgi:hypothetical protein